MTELILSDITRMGPGFCIIGLERTADGFRSLRPLPRTRHAWPRNFPYRRGHRLHFYLSSIFPERPHVEDRSSTGVIDTVGRVPEERLLECMRGAELDGDMRGLFGCPVYENVRGKGFYVMSGAARRSTCGVDIRNFRFSAVSTKEARVDVLFPDGSRVELPLVDHTWRAFVEYVWKQLVGANRAQRVEHFFQSRLPRRLLSESTLFVRIGVTRPERGRCWLMLDSLFPQPHRQWLQEFR